MDLNDVYTIKIDDKIVYINESGVVKVILENIPDFLKEEIAEIIKSKSIDREMIY